MFVFHYNLYGHILYRFQDKARYWLKIVIFFIPPSTYNNNPWGNGCEGFCAVSHKRARFLAYIS